MVVEMKIEHSFGGELERISFLKCILLSTKICCSLVTLFEKVPRLVHLVSVILLLFHMLSTLSVSKMLARLGTTCRLSSETFEQRIVVQKILE